MLCVFLSNFRSFSQPTIDGLTTAPGPPHTCSAIERGAKLLNVGPSVRRVCRSLCHVAAGMHMCLVATISKRRGHTMQRLSHCAAGPHRTSARFAACDLALLDVRSSRMVIHQKTKGVFLAFWLVIQPTTRQENSGHADAHLTRRAKLAFVSPRMLLCATAHDNRFLRLHLNEFKCT